MNSFLNLETKFSLHYPPPSPITLLMSFGFQVIVPSLLNVHCKTYLAPLLRMYEVSRLYETRSEDIAAQSVTLQKTFVLSNI